MHTSLSCDSSVLCTQIDWNRSNSIDRATVKRVGDADLPGCTARKGLAERGD